MVRKTAGSFRGHITGDS